MAYFNFTLAHSKGLTPNMIILLQLIKQNKTEDNLSPFIAMMMEDEVLDILEQDGIVEYIKGNKKQTQFEKMRLSSKGLSLLEDLETPELTEGDVQMAEYLMQMYLNHEDKERVIGNKKKVKMYCAIFRNRMQLTLHQMYWLSVLFLEEYQFTKKLENIFFDSNKHRYGKFENHFEDSPLFQFFDENRARVEKFWSQKIKE